MVYEKLELVLDFENFPLFFMVKWQLLPWANRLAFPVLYCVTLCRVCFRHFLPLQKVRRCFGTLTWMQEPEMNSTLTKKENSTPILVKKQNGRKMTKDGRRCKAQIIIFLTILFARSKERGPYHIQFLNIAPRHGYFMSRLPPRLHTMMFHRTAKRKKCKFLNTPS